MANMLRVLQFLVSSPGFISSPFQKRWKPFSNNGISFFSICTKSSSLSIEATPLVFPLVSTPRNACFRSFRMSAIRSESRSDDLLAPASSSPSPSSTIQGLAHTRKISFCQWCGAATQQIIPDGDDKVRSVCTHCGKIAYQNPKMVVGCLVEHDDKVLLCKRNIQPAYGLWTLPAGYMEIGESAVEGATRETWEEACAEVEVLSPFAQLDIPLIGQTYIIFRARLKKPHFSPGPESLDCQLFALDDIPFDSLAFSSMLVTLNLYIEDLKAGKLKFHYCTINKRVGTGPSDIRDYTLDDHLQS